MRDEIEDYLRRAGELPSGIELGQAQIYVEMKGHGEIWLDEDNLPVRQTIHLEFPPEEGGLNWVSADITTDFSGWEEGLTAKNQGIIAFQRFRKDPTLLFTNPQSLIPYSPLRVPTSYSLQQFTLSLSLTLLALGLVALTILYSCSPKFYAAIALAVILSMVLTPLMQSHQVYAFYERQQAKQAEQQQQREQQQKMEDRQAEISGRNFNPHEKPIRELPSPNPHMRQLKQFRP